MRHTTAKGGTALSEAKKQNYLHGAAIMVGTTVIVKIAAFFYKLPLGSMKLLGDEGFAHFMVAYNIYSFFLTLATAGFPVALSRMISEADTLDRPAQVQRIFRTAAGDARGHRRVLHADDAPLQPAACRDDGQCGRRAEHSRACARRS